MTRLNEKKIKLRNYFRKKYKSEILEKLLCTDRKKIIRIIIKRENLARITARKWGGEK